ncbi:ribonuclease HII [bacterium (Candidatus Torokbacteria) CG_4_10_14_0_2_um_filter_35_8]|nr:MAG: ribonuclease HII [bacterium (Candidatus Torokbacteria) CG_4_10_14_0_2_um_filter_35_8]
MYTPNFSLERKLHNQGFETIVGIDEVGIGALAGPVVAAAVFLPFSTRISGIKDSKKLLAKKRENLYSQILKLNIKFGIGQIDPSIIDRINIYKASQLARKKAFKDLQDKIGKIDYVLVDGRIRERFGIPSKSIIKGDRLCMSIACASVIAKVYRDQLISKMDKVYPGYTFSHHKGYGSKEHHRNILRNGVSPIHRKSYGGVKWFLANKKEYESWVLSSK